jgi:YebC/PmpR family DNA-binding regulatory protein
MSGHSKWATIKRKKEANDNKRGAIFTKHAKNIAVAARNGKDPDMNAALRSAVDSAKADNMPKDNIEKAILKGAGELPGAVYEEVIYEGYGPGGIAMVIECVTDNTNRTVSFLRSTLDKNGGSLGNSGSVLYMFEQKGIIRIATADLAGHDPEDIELFAIDAGADDIVSEEEGLTIVTPREHLDVVRGTLAENGMVATSAGVEWYTKNMMDVPEQNAGTLSTLIETLEDNEDVNAVHTNSK